MIEQVEHIKKFALQDNSALTVKQFGEAIARMCDDAIREAVEQPRAPDADEQNCPACDGSGELCNQWGQAVPCDECKGTGSSNRSPSQVTQRPLS